MQIKRIAILGPESSGKTTLCRYLAGYFGTVYAHEYVRGYLRRGKTITSKEDLYLIACRQLLLEQTRIKKAQHWLFCDTELINLKVWSELEFGGCDERLAALLASHRYDLYLLLRPNVAWSHDGLRQGQIPREQLFETYKCELERLGTAFLTIEALGADRNVEAVSKLVAHFGLADDLGTAS